MIPATTYTDIMSDMRRHGTVRTINGKTVKVGFFDPAKQPPPPDVGWGLFIKGSRIFVGEYTAGDPESSRKQILEVADDWRS